MKVETTRDIDLQLLYPTFQVGSLLYSYFNRIVTHK